LSSSEKFIREYVYTQAPRYWYQADYDCSHLWEGIELAPLMDSFFAEILPSVDVMDDLEKIKVLILHAIGMSDYDCCPWMWGKIENLPSNMTNAFFHKSGGIGRTMKKLQSLMRV